ncbi:MULTISPECIES: hypothetical protein [Streptomyces]|uniref:Uncharacterized protein n=1 Tax=Streptomyces lonegramiae TaxID=3075524 RepID=A0ABU2XAA3_9ACTN|nr:hypothetical protein [Streptomyces sp. DSM 41529]MDT0542384.1 hypothetical protein [Streptomyces sp. DSM 41529]
MAGETVNPPGQADEQHEQQGQQGSGDRPTLAELRQQSVALGEQIAQHLARGPK